MSKINDLLRMMRPKTNKELYEIIEQKTNPLSDEGANEIIQNLKNKYGVDVHFLNNKDLNFSEQYLPPSNKHSLKMYMTDEEEELLNRKYPGIFEDDRGIIVHNNDKHVLLHESGHAIDPNSNGFEELVSQNYKLQEKAKPLASFGGVATGIGMDLGHKEERSATDNLMLGTGLLGIGIGGTLGYRSGKNLERLEDNANSFVNRYLEDELGDANEVKKSIKDSLIPEARKTYSRDTLKRMVKPMGRGFIGAGLVGAGVYGVNKLRNEDDEKMASITMQGLYKEALTAQKARELANKAGLVPEGNWKWALRQMRDGRGDLLEGRALAEAKEKMGKTPNNVRQKIEAISRKSGEQEVGSVIYKDKSMNTGLNEKMPKKYMRQDEDFDQYFIGDREGILHPSSVKDSLFEGELSHNIHTHVFKPAYKHSQNEEKRRIGLKGAQLVTPSGQISGEAQGVTLRNYMKDKNYQKTHADYDMFLTGNTFNKELNNNIIDPLYGYEGVHRARPDFMRSVYFKNQGRY